MSAAASRRSFVGDTLCSRSSAVSVSAYVTPLALNGPAFSSAPAAEAYSLPSGATLPHRYRPRLFIRPSAVGVASSSAR